MTFLRNKPNLFANVAGKTSEPTRVLSVALNGTSVGRIAMGSDRRCVFEYNNRWVQSGFSISPFHLPLQNGLFTARYEPFDGLFGVFNDSLPDGWGALLADRWLRRQQIEPASLSVLDRLTLVGNNGTGALSYEPDMGVGMLTFGRDIDRIAAEVQKVLADSADAELEKLIRMGESSAGARPKVMVTLDNEGWLIKFPASSDPADIGQLEFRYSEIARKCGIGIPETRLFSGKYFGVKRFDRKGGGRVHVHSAAGLLYASHRYPSLDYTSLIKATMALTRNIEECFKVFRLMIFNVITGNRDDHSRNFSFIFESGRWQFSPAYDLVKSNGFNGFHSTTVAGSGNPGRKEIIMVAEETGLPKKRASAIFEEVVEGARELICVKI